VSLRMRVTSVLTAAAVAVAFVVFVVVHFLLPVPPTVVFTADRLPSRAVNMTIQIDGINDSSSTPDWVSYFVRSPHGTKWIHSTIWQLPAHTRVNVTAYEFDTCDPLRNNYWGHVTGTTGGVMYVNGRRESVVNSDTTCSVAHTFTVPQLGINIPFDGVPYTAKNQCGPGQAPCSLSLAHQVVKFSFMTHGPGEYRWQCFIPCGLASVDGNGHAMGTLGFMSGFLNVVA
jgi:hypothetical protein